MKRLYARLRRWLGRFLAPRTGESIVFAADEVRGIDPVSGRVMWFITKGGSIEITGAAVQPSGDRSDRQAGL